MSAADLASETGTDVKVGEQYGNPVASSKAPEHQAGYFDVAHKPVVLLDEENPYSMASSSDARPSYEMAAASGSLVSDSHQTGYFDVTHQPGASSEPHEVGYFDVNQQPVVFAEEENPYSIASSTGPGPIYEMAGPRMPSDGGYLESPRGGRGYDESVYDIADLGQLEDPAGFGEHDDGAGKNHAIAPRTESPLPQIFPNCPFFGPPFSFFHPPFPFVPCPPSSFLLPPFSSPPPLFPTFISFISFLLGLL